jgi:hypothetical protein
MFFANHSSHNFLDEQCRKYRRKLILEQARKVDWKASSFQLGGWVNAASPTSNVPSPSFERLDKVRDNVRAEV